MPDRSGATLLRRLVAGLRDTGRSLGSVFRNRNLRRIQLALLASLIGDTAYATAVTVWAYGVGGASAVGVFTAVRMASAAVTAPIGAALADRFPRRTTLLATDGARVVLVATAALCLPLDSPLPVFVLATLAGVLNAPFRSAQRAWMPALAEHPLELTASNATSGTLESIAVFIGPALGGLLLLVTSVSTVFVLNVVTFLVSMALVLGVRPARATPSVRPPGEPAEPPQGVVTELAAGFRTVLGDGDLRVVTGQVCAQTFVGGAAKVFLVVLAVEVMRTGASGVGLLDAVIGVGAIVGGLLAVARATRQRLGRDLALGVLLWSVPLTLIVVWPTPVIVVAALVLLGVGNPLVDVNLDTIIQRMTPEGLMARVFGALDTCYIATGALGSLAMPLLLAWIDLRWTLLVVAAPVALVAALSLPRMGRLDDRLRAPVTLPLLQAIAWLSPLPPAVLESLARGLEPRRVTAGQAVMTQGEAADRFYVIESGRVEVTQDGRVLRQQGPGDFFGEIGLLRDLPRTATVTATEDTVLQGLDRDRFLGAVTLQNRTLAEGVASRRLAFRG